MLNARERWDVKDMFLDLISQILIFPLVLCESVLFNEGFSTDILFQAICRTLNRSMSWSVSLSSSVPELTRHGLERGLHVNP